MYVVSRHPHQFTILLCNCICAGMNTYYPTAYNNIRLHLWSPGRTGTQGQSKEAGQQVSTTVLPSTSWSAAHSAYWKSSSLAERYQKRCHHNLSTADCSRCGRSRICNTRAPPQVETVGRRSFPTILFADNRTGTLSAAPSTTQWQQSLYPPQGIFQPADCTTTSLSILDLTRRW